MYYFCEIVYWLSQHAYGQIFTYFLHFYKAFLDAPYLVVLILTTFEFGSGRKFFLYRFDYRWKI